MSYMKDIAKAY